MNKDMSTGRFFRGNTRAILCCCFMHRLKLSWLSLVKSYKRIRDRATVSDGYSHLFRLNGLHITHFIVPSTFFRSTLNPMKFPPGKLAGEARVLDRSSKILWQHLRSKRLSVLDEKRFAAWQPFDCMMVLIGTQNVPELIIISIDWRNNYVSNK
jgi:hypothetical protein